MDRKILGEQLRQEIRAKQQEWNTLQTQLEGFISQAEADCQTLMAENADLKRKNAQLQEKVEQLQSALTQALACPEEVEEEEKLPLVEDTLEEKVVPLKKEEPVKPCDGRLIHDLRKAIGLNDRFRLKHDLFQDQEELMWATLDALNAMHSWAEAMDYLQTHFSWNPENATVVYFKEILGRKFYRS